MIDLHSHILSGLDDGVSTLEEARELARRAAGEGVTAIAATPHVRDDYPTTPQQMEDGVVALQDDFRTQGIELEVLPGAEVALNRLPLFTEDELVRFSLAQSGKYLLLEFPYTGWPRKIDSSLRWVRGEGLTPILAHPERNREVQEAPERASSCSSPTAHWFR